MLFVDKNSTLLAARLIGVDEKDFNDLIFPKSTWKEPTRKGLISRHFWRYLHLRRRRMVPRRFFTEPHLLSLSSFLPPSRPARRTIRDSLKTLTAVVNEIDGYGTKINLPKVKSTTSKDGEGRPIHLEYATFIVINTCSLQTAMADLSPIELWWMSSADVSTYFVFLLYSIS